jgi:hypothetical protein
MTEAWPGSCRLRWTKSLLLLFFRKEGSAYFIDFIVLLFL